MDLNSQRIEIRKHREQHLENLSLLLRTCVGLNLNIWIWISRFILAAQMRFALDVLAVAEVDDNSMRKLNSCARIRSVKQPAVGIFIGEYVCILLDEMPMNDGNYATFWNDDNGYPNKIINCMHVGSRWVCDGANLANEHRRISPTYIGHNQSLE